MRSSQAREEASTLREMRSRAVRDKASVQRKLEVATHSCSRRKAELQEQIKAAKWDPPSVFILFLSLLLNLL